MIVYDGIYRLPDETNRGLKPRTQWECAWHVRIINLGLNPSLVEYLKSMIVVATQTGNEPCLTSCAESIGKKVSRDFDLDIPRVLWVEHFPNNRHQWFAAGFRLKSSYGPDIDYHIQWRPLRPKEMDIIKPFIPEIDIGA